MLLPSASSATRTGRRYHRTDLWLSYIPQTLTRGFGRYLLACKQIRRSVNLRARINSRSSAMPCWPTIQAKPKRCVTGRTPRKTRSWHIWLLRSKNCLPFRFSNCLPFRSSSHRLALKNRLLSKTRRRRNCLACGAPRKTISRCIASFSFFSPARTSGCLKATAFSERSRAATRPRRSRWPTNGGKKWSVVVGTLNKARHAGNPHANAGSPRLPVFYREILQKRVCALLISGLRFGRA